MSSVFPNIFYIQLILQVDILMFVFLANHNVCAVCCISDRYFCLKCSASLTKRRVGISNNEFVVFDQTQTGEYHGHVRSWRELTRAMQDALEDAGLVRVVNNKGKII